jgi:hypothetical protein
MTAAIQDEEAHLFQPAVAYRFPGPGFFIVSGVPVGQNPPTGVVVFYSLKDKPKDPVTMEFTDAQGKLLRKFSSKKEQGPAAEEEFPQLGRGGDVLPVEKGLNRFVWNMEVEPPAKVPGVTEWGGQASGPAVPPGTYQVKLTIAGKSYSAPAEIRKDPRSGASQADLEKQFDLASKIAASINEGHLAVNQIRSVRSQTDEIKKRLAGDEKAKPILDAIDALNKKMSAIESKIVEPRAKSNEDSLNYPVQVGAQLTILEYTVESADSAPTRQSGEVYAELLNRLNPQLNAWREAQAKDLAALNELIIKSNIPPVAPLTEPKK